MCEVQAALNRRFASAGGGQCTGVLVAGIQFGQCAIESRYGPYGLAIGSPYGNDGIQFLVITNVFSRPPNRQRTPNRGGHGSTSDSECQESR